MTRSRIEFVFNLVYDLHCPNRESSGRIYNDFSGGLWQKASRNWAAAVGGSKMVDCSI